MVPSGTLPIKQPRGLLIQGRHLSTFFCSCHVFAASRSLASKRPKATCHAAARLAGVAMAGAPAEPRWANRDGDQTWSKPERVSVYPGGKYPIWRSNQEKYMKLLSKMRFTLPPIKCTSNWRQCCWTVLILPKRWASYSRVANQLLHGLKAWAVGLEFRAVIISHTWVPSAFLRSSLCAICLYGDSKWVKRSAGNFLRYDWQSQGTSCHRPRKAACKWDMIGNLHFSRTRTVQVFTGIYLPFHAPCIPCTVRTVTTSHDIRVTTVTSGLHIQSASSRLRVSQTCPTLRSWLAPRAPWCLCYLWRCPRMYRPSRCLPPKSFDFPWGPWARCKCHSPEMQFPRTLHPNVYLAPWRFLR